MMEPVTAPPDRPGDMGRVRHQGHGGTAASAAGMGHDARLGDAWRRAGHDRHAFLLEAGIEQVGHHRRTLRVAAGAEHHRDQPDVAAARRGNHVVPGVGGIAGLEAVGSGIGTQHRVVVADIAAVEHEGRHREIVILVGEVADQVPGQQREVACGRDLLRIRQAGGIAEGGVGHAEQTRLLGHELGEVLLVAAGHQLAERASRVIGRLRDQGQDGLLHGKIASGHQPELGGFHGSRAGGYRDRLVQRHAIVAQRLEREIEGHQLGQAGRITLQVGVVLLQHLPGVGVHHERADLADILGLSRLCGHGGDASGREDRERAQPTAVQHSPTDCHTHSPHSAGRCGKNRSPRVGVMERP